MSQGKKPKSKDKLSKVLTAVLEIVDLCRQGQPAADTYVDVLRWLGKLTSFDAATVYLFESSGGRLLEAASVGGTVEVLDFLKIENGEGLAGWTADSKKPILLADRTRHHDFDPDIDFASFLSMPLMVEEEVIGVINFGSRTTGAFSSDDVQLLSLVSAQVALCFEKLQYQKKYDTTKDQLDDLEAKLKHLQQQPTGLDPAELKEKVGRINHDINNSLAILLGNVQCMLMQKTVVDQGTLSRLKRMERALMKINEANHTILQLAGISTYKREGNSDDEIPTEKVLTKNG